MRTRHQFRPSGSWILEDRVALSTTAAAADVASAATTARNLRLTFQGFFVTVPPQGIGGGDTTSLSGSARFPGVGPIKVVGSLQSNPSVAPPFSRLRGVLIITVPRQTGSGVLVVTGPATDLSPTRRSVTPLNTRVVSATGVFAPFAGGSGTGTLLLRSRPVGAPGGLISGRFSLQLVNG
jgi:hypothetical protein